jgi:hypothetical protein
MFGKVRASRPDIDSELSELRSAEVYVTMPRGQMASIVDFARDRGEKIEVMKWLVAEEGLEPPTRGL